jgi:hypothetical protein
MKWSNCTIWQHLHKFCILNSASAACNYSSVMKSSNPPPPFSSNRVGGGAERSQGEQSLLKVMPTESWFCYCLSVSRRGMDFFCNKSHIQMVSIWCGHDPRYSNFISQFMFPWIRSLIHATFSSMLRMKRYPEHSALLTYVTPHLSSDNHFNDSVMLTVSSLKQVLMSLQFL